jgi:hypothetical protein
LVEIQEARLVFQSTLDIDRIWIHEQVGFPNWIARIGSALSRQKGPSNNAITLANNLYFPVEINTSDTALSNMELRDISWLMHELTHAWQYQHIGIRYLFDAIRAHMRLGKTVYDFGGQKGLEAARDVEMSFFEFNPEQQGDIVRSYYHLLKHGESTTAWDPFIAEIRDRM